MDIFEALEQDNVTAIKQLIEKNINVVYNNKSGKTPLLLFCLKTHTNIGKAYIEIIELLLQKNVDFKFVAWDYIKNTDNINENLIELFLKYNVIQNNDDSILREILFNACKTGNKNLVQLLINNGVNLNIIDQRNETPLHWITYYFNKKNAQNKIEIMKLLIQQGININAQNKFGDTVLHGIVTRDDITEFIDAVELLINSGASLNIKNHRNTTPLHYICSTKSNYENKIVKIITKNKIYIDVNVKNEHGETPLHIACRNGHFYLAKLLIQHGADVNAKNNANQTPLHLACENRKLKIVELLLQHNANVNDVDEDYNTPLHYLCNRNDVFNSGVVSKQIYKIAELLLQAGADVDMKNYNDATPLNYLCYHNSKCVYFELTKLLVKYSKNIEINKQIKQKFLFQLCQKYRIVDDDIAFMKLLIEKGIDVNTKDVHNHTPLHYACLYGHIEVINFLLQQKADIYIPDSKFQPLYYILKKINDTNVNDPVRQQLIDISIAMINKNENLKQLMLKQYKQFFPNVVDIIVKQMVTHNIFNKIKKQFYDEKNTKTPFI